MKDSNLLSPDLHDFSDINVGLGKTAAMVGRGIMACLVIGARMASLRMTPAIKAPVRRRPATVPQVKP
ncbi:hypothetical protein [Rhodopila sp.]|uniref:hypothetical protein n=1 Tax=Rhodopila sp. TaxID=2480087 RepID=UPI002BE7F6C1|nr:hypothetical protein [Rhodopila sp.]HVZ09181.1 hypothetical protein [Rhodopila sp.]